MKTDSLQLWRFFCETAARGGINAASDALGCEPSTLSRAVKTLEAELGRPLFRREGRGLVLTELGHMAERRARDVLARHDRMIADLKGDRDALSGSICLATHAGSGPSTMTSALVDFMRIYPDMQISLLELQGTVPECFDASASDGAVPDVAMSYGPEAPIPGLVSRFIGEMPFIPCASPLYIQRRGAPLHPAECIEHTGILTMVPTRELTQVLECNGRTEELRWKATITFKSLLAGRSAAALGAGIVPDLPLFHFAKLFRAGELVPVMRGWRHRTALCYAYATEEGYEKRRVRLLLDWISENQRQLLAKLREDFPEFY